MCIRLPILLGEYLNLSRVLDDDDSSRYFLILTLFKERTSFKFIV